MKYQNLNNEISSFSFQTKFILNVGTLFFSLGSSILVFSLLVFRIIWSSSQKIISWNGSDYFVFDFFVFQYSFCSYLLNF